MSIESTLLGKYNMKVKATFIAGFILFLLSEIMFFGSFFWTFFDRLFHITSYTFFFTNLEGFETLKWNTAPLLATTILISSGYFYNHAYYALLARRITIFSAYSTSALLLGFLFIYMQYLEYTELYATFSDTVFFSIFYLITGFHGVHVLIGTIFISKAHDAVTLSDNTVSTESTLLVLFALIYWHFVDTIWILVMLFIYQLNAADTFTLVNYNNVSIGKIVLPICNECTELLQTTKKLLNMKTTSASYFIERTIQYISNKS